MSGPACATGRPTADRCPGVLRLHDALDGPMARIRVPGGMLTAESLTGLVWVADTFGDGNLELTSRGNVQLRGLADADPERLARTFSAYGLLPCPERELARTILMPTLTGLDADGSRPDVTPLVHALDAAICAAPGLDDLSGRFAFGLDDGRGEVLSLAPDLAAVAGPDGRYTVVVAGRPAVAVPADRVATVLVSAAAHFLAWNRHAQARYWRLEESPEAVAAVVDRLAGIPGATAPQALPAPAAPPSPGFVTGPDGAHHLVVALPFGHGSTAQWQLLRDVAGPRGLRVTPWLLVVVTDVDATPDLVQMLAEHGLESSSDSRWARVSACQGGLGCGRTERQVRAEARLLVQGLTGPEAVAARSLGLLGGGRVHLSGCDRRCGHPRVAYRDLLAVDGGGWAAQDRW